ncbi:MAG: HAMP domain-containing protein [Acidobacteria bacterium]|nr:HAMP domain-containing protein [Acidobacteriota bacterium]
MSTSTRLILLLTALVGTIMVTGGYLRLRQREAIVMTAMHNEVQAHAYTLQAALEVVRGQQDSGQTQQLLNRLIRNPKIYSVILFDEAGRATTLSDPLAAEALKSLPEVRQVLASGEPMQAVRETGGRQVFSVVMPVQLGAGRRGAFEITQPLSFVQADIARARRDVAWITLSLFAAITLGVLAVMSYNIWRPIRELLVGADALGRGELDHRVNVPDKGSEFARLAESFNHMAERLSRQRETATREAEERLTLERELRFQEVELRHRDRLATVGRLAAGVAHEMAAPLNVIDARAEQVQTRTDAPLATRQRNLTIIREQTERITQIVRQLLNLARPYELRRESLDLSQVIHDTVESLEADAQRSGVQFNVISNGPNGKVSIDADRGFLQQVLLNICRNGLQAMPAGGALRIETHAEAITKEGRDFVVLRITDTGAGIAEEHLAHIFDPFYTTKEVGSGTGLGLSVAHRIVEEHGGWIEAANASPHGATFNVYLPQSM